MAEAKKGNKTVLWVALGCGGLLLLLGITCVAVPFAAAYFGKKKLAEEVSKNNPALGQAISQGSLTGGVQAGAGQMVAAGAAAYGSMVMVAALPKEEQAEQAMVLERLVKVGPQLSEDDIKAIGEAMDQVQKAHQEDKAMPTEDEVRTFLDTLRSIAERYEPK